MMLIMGTSFIFDDSAKEEPGVLDPWGVFSNMMEIPDPTAPPQPTQKANALLRLLRGSISVQRVVRKHVSILKPPGLGTSTDFSRSRVISVFS